MAAVYAAHDTLLDRPVAIKVLAEHLNEDVAARERFQREARAAAALSFHPGIVTIFDVGEHEGRSFIVMELLRGGTIGDVLRSSDRPDHAQVTGWIRAVAAALDTAHERGIVHRDIKPANLLLDEKGTVAVADFGIARLAWEDAVTMTGQVLGTAAYISPEQAKGDPATPASDRYALTVVAYELLTGSRPFDGEHFAAQARAHIEDEPKPPSHQDPSLPRALDPVISRGMAKDPAARWPTAAAFAEAVADALRPTEAHVAAAPAPETAATTQLMAPPAEGAVRVARRPVATAPPRPAPRSRNLLGVALGLGLLALALAAILIASSSGDDPSRKTAAKPTATPAQKDTSDEKATPTPTEASEAEPGTPDAPTGGITSLNDRGWALYTQEKYAESIPFFREAARKCGDSGKLVCQYALYNLGSALHRSGDSAEGLPFLQKRLERFPENQPDVVRAEIAAACTASGQQCGGDENGAGNSKGNGKGRNKKD